MSALIARASRHRMSDNPYAAPAAPVRDATLFEWSWGAVVVAALATLGTFYASALVLTPVLQQWYLAQGVAPAALSRTLYSMIEAVLIWQGFAACAYAVGGALAAMRAPVHPYLAAGLAALLAKGALTLQYASVAPNPYPAWSQLLGYATPIPAALLGAWLALRLIRKPG